MKPVLAIRLPKTIEADPRAERLIHVLSTGHRRLWSKGTLTLAEARPNDALCEAIRAAHRVGRVVRSLEKADVFLTAERRGQTMADRKTGVLRAGRLSRLILLATDGAERFYRRVETLIHRNHPRVAGVFLAAEASHMGALIFGPDSSARLLLINHKEAVGAVLLTLADQWRFSNDAGPSSFTKPVKRGAANRILQQREEP